MTPNGSTQEPGTRVLHIDDEKDQLTFTKLFLKKADPSLEVTSVGSPEEALRLLEEESFDCIISDFKMPRMTGIKLAKKVRESSSTPFILYTGHGSEEVAEEAFSVGIDDYIRKEIESSHYQVLANRIRNAVKKHKAERRLSESEERYRTLVESSPNPTSITVEKTIVYANRKRAELSGFTDPSDIIGMSTFDFVHEDDREKIQERIDARQRGEEIPATYEFRIVRHDGEVRHILTSMAPVEFDGREAMFHIHQDITEMKEMAEERRRYTRDLEGIVKEKTRALIDAERMAAAGSIAAMLGHDLRGPLQTIRNALYLIRNMPERSEQGLEIIEASVLRANEMLGKIRSKTTDIPVRLRPTDIRDLIETTVKGLSIPSHVNLETEFGDDLDDLELDPEQIQRVLENLMMNALKAMPDWGLLTVRAAKTDGELVVEISDTGIGIKEEEKVNMFKPFYTTKESGMGLGLAYCKRTVEAHGGSMAFESREGEGSTFRFRIPAR
ncbi:MAG TPA: ATP-binding protein [Patescibacteria group bacterium]|nr:ATP-binding protein [Patescibacteria group bacterium]